jgi:hypothetical protein
MAGGGEWSGRNERRRAVLAHAVGFVGANLVCGTLTLVLLHAAGPTLGWALPASLAISALALGAACMLAGAALLMLCRASETPAATHTPLSLRRRDDSVAGTVLRRLAAGSQTTRPVRNPPRAKPRRGQRIEG